jgi:anion-transporting  ArsA/GET3 family ATPase
MTSALDELLTTRHLVVFVGEGGVGKTSCAAASALRAAEHGRRVAVLTIDPAPRLGNALGIDAIDGHPRAVALTGPRATSGGSLVAMKLDTQGTFDRMVESFAPNADAAHAVLKNPIYRMLSGSLGGSDSYMAFQRLYELIQHEDYDLIVVDTPPAAHARALLSAPLRLTGLVETGAASVLKNPAVMLARAGTTVARATAAILLTVLERATGIGLGRQVAEFTASFEDVLQGLTVRAAHVDALLREPRTAFVEVVRPRADSVSTALVLRQSLQEMDLDADLVIVNRVTPAPGAERALPLGERLAGAPDGTLLAVEEIERELDLLRTVERTAVAELRSGLTAEPGKHAPAIIEMAALDHDVSCLADLEALGASLARA